MEEIKTYYCFIPNEAKELLKQYIEQFKQQTGRSVILTPAKYSNVSSGLTTAQGYDIYESTQLLGYCLTADSVDINEEILNLIKSVNGEYFDNSNDYLEFIAKL